MKLERSYQDSRRRLLHGSGGLVLVHALRADPALNDLEDVVALLALLECRSEVSFSCRDAAVRGLLRGMQQQSSRYASTALFVAFYPTIRRMCRELRDGLRARELEERHAVVLHAFFEAAAKTPCEPRATPTVCALVFKARQYALRGVERSVRPRRFEVPWTDFERRLPARTVTPEAALVCRETALLIDEVLQSSTAVAHTLAESGQHAKLLLEADGDDSLRERARSLDPSVTGADLRRLHQRLRQQRSRTLRGARKISARKLSQIRGCLDLWDQEGWQ